MANSGWYFGVDTNSSLEGVCDGTNASEHFYIGRLGGNTTPSTSGFNTATAETVGPYKTFGFWDLVGPEGDPSLDPATYGTDQANAFIKAWSNNNLVGGGTLFCDIEPGNGGLSNGGFGSDTSANQALLEAFLSTVRGVDATIYPGIYTTADFFNTAFGSTYVPSTAFVLWLAAWNCVSDCTTIQDDFNASHLNQVVGGYKVIIWQYWGSQSCGGNQDLDVTPYDGFFTNLGYSWHPVAG